MTEKESVMAFMKSLTNQADLETIMSLIFEAVEISGDEINRFGYFTLEALLEYANPYLLSYVQKLKKPMRKKWRKNFAKQFSLANSIRLDRKEQTTASTIISSMTKYLNRRGIHAMLRRNRKENRWNRFTHMHTAATHRIIRMTDGA